MKNTNIILKQIQKEIAPTEKEIKLMENSVNDFTKKVSPYLKKIKAEIFIGGSLAKNTMIRKSKEIGYDIDIFVMFPKTYRKKTAQISKILENILKKAQIKYLKLGGSRDYFQIKQKGNVSIEIVPIIKIKKSDEALNITDISPLHVTYITRKVKKNKKLADEIRLAKAFCYAQDCYGAESYIQGFSGYVIEVLITYYGSFINLIKAVSKWQIKNREKIIIDPARYYKTRKQLLESINRAKTHSPIILVDPVQKQRNAAAALGYDTLDKFIKSCQKFLKNPNKKFFYKQKTDINKLKKDAKKLKARFYSIHIKSTKKKIDIAGAKLKKFFDFLIREAKKHGFKISKSIYDFNESTLEADYYIILKNPDKNHIIPGPPLNIDEKHIKKFKKAWPKTIIKNNRIYAKSSRKILSFEKFIHYIKKQRSKILREMGISKIEIK